MEQRRDAVKGVEKQMKEDKQAEADRLVSNHIAAIYYRYEADKLG